MPVTDLEDFKYQYYSIVSEIAQKAVKEGDFNGEDLFFDAQDGIDFGKYSAEDLRLQELNQDLRIDRNIKI